MNELLSFGLLVFTSFFSLINPLGIMPVFITMTADLTPAQRRATARKATFVAFITLMVFAFSGQLLFKFFGISVNSFRIVGGVIFFLMGMDMLQARLGKVKISSSEVKKYVNDISVTPLAIPILCGPGAITNSIVLMEDAASVTHKLILVLAMFSVLFIAFLALLGSTKIVKFLGETGNKVLMRLMGLILMVIAVEFFFSGLKPFLLDILNKG